MEDFGQLQVSIVGHQSYRKNILYRHCKFPFSPYTKVASCPLSGPIAIASLKDETNDKNFVVKVYACNGELLSQIEASHLYKLFWTVAQKLILLTKNGRVLVYTAKGKSHKTFYMDDKTESLDIINAKTFLSNNAVTGLACLKSNGHFYAVNDVENAMLWRIVDMAYRNAIPTVWAMVPSDDVPLLVCYTPRDGFRMSGQGKSVVPRAASWMRPGEYIEMVTDFSERFICLSHISSIVQIVASNLSELIHEFDLSAAKINMVALKMLWFKDKHLIVQTNRNRIQCFVTDDDPTEFAYHAEIQAFGDIDGVQLFTSDGVDMVSPISQSMRRTLGLSSSAPAAYLYEASMKFKQKDPLVNDYITQIGDHLSDAVRDCFAAALEIRQDEEEVNLFTAALFGQALRKVEKSKDRIEFAQTCKMLRILRFVYSRGIPLSFAQLEHLGVEGLIDRLIEMGNFAAADTVAQQTNPTSRSRIVAHWALDAMDHVQSGFVDENELGDRIIQRFHGQNYVSFSATAEAAAQKGLTKLATRLLDLEEDVTQQVTSYLKLKQLDKALKMSAKSKDPDLVYMVIRHLKAGRSEKEVALALQKIPYVFEMYKKLTRDENAEDVLSLFIQADDFRRQVLYYLSQLPNSAMFDITEHANLLAKIADALKSNNSTTLSQLITQHKDMAKTNAGMEETHGVPLTDKTVKETYMWAVVNNHTYAETLRKQHKLSDKQYWIWKMTAYANSEQWDRLEHFVHETKSPVGLMPLIQILAKHNQKERAMKFIEKMPLNEQTNAYSLIGEVRKAAHAAGLRFDVQRLMQLRLQQPQESEGYEIVDEILEKIHSQSQPSTSANT